MIIRIFTVLALILALAGCNSIPKGAFALSPTSLEDRELQTRVFENTTEAAILGASAGVIQDLGYTISESETLLGVISATKVADATNAGQVVGAIFLALLGGGATPIDDEQHIKLGLVVKPNSSAEEAYDVRVTFQRVVYNTQGGVSRSEPIKALEVYQEFFEKLSKSVFLEENL